MIDCFGEFSSQIISYFVELLCSLSCSQFFKAKGSRTAKPQNVIALILTNIQIMVFSFNSWINIKIYLISDKIIITILVIIKVGREEGERSKKREEKYALKPAKCQGTMPIAFCSLSLILTVLKSSVVILTLKIGYLRFREVK